MSVRAAIGPMWMMLCSGPLPMIEPTVRASARVDSAAASTSAISWVALSSASSSTRSHDQSARSAWMIALTSSVSVAAGCGSSCCSRVATRRST